jgi:hypothetical protein
VINWLFQKRVKKIDRNSNDHQKELIFDLRGLEIFKPLHEVNHNQEQNWVGMNDVIAE